MHHEQPPDRRRPFRFGVLGERIRSCDGLLAEARRAEALSYATLLLRDRFMREPFGDQLAPMVALAAAAGATRTLRVGRFEESLRVLKGLLAGPAFTFAGAHYSVTGLEGFPRPVQRPRPPILVGAGSKRMLGIAAPRPGRP